MGYGLYYKSTHNKQTYDVLAYNKSGYGKLRYYKGTYSKVSYIKNQNERCFGVGVGSRL